ncbi:MAG: type II secretion system protein [Chloroflexi bacterium]|nr:type II secretion system protein [Chloroflexota bacterium]
MISKRQEGFTLIELLVAVAITGAIAGVLAITISQFITISKQGTERLIALDEVQNVTRWIARDMQSAFIAGTLPGCTTNCSDLTLTIVDPSGNVVYDPPDPAKGQTSGTLIYETIDTVHYFTDGLNVYRAFNDSGTLTISESADISFTLNTIQNTRERHFVTLDITSPVEGGSDVVEQTHIYLRTTGE